MPVGTGGQRSRWESSQYPARVPQEQGCDGVEPHPFPQWSSLACP